MPFVIDVHSSDHSAERTRIAVLPAENSTQSEWRYEMEVSSMRSSDDVGVEKRDEKENARCMKLE